MITSLRLPPYSPCRADTLADVHTWQRPISRAPHDRVRRVTLIQPRRNLQDQKIRLPMRWELCKSKRPLPRLGHGAARLEIRGGRPHWYRMRTCAVRMLDPGSGAERACPTHSASVAGLRLNFMADHPCAVMQSPPSFATSVRDTSH